MEFEIQVKTSSLVIPKEIPVTVLSAFVNSKSAIGFVGLRNALANPLTDPAVFSITGPGNYHGENYPLGYEIPGGGLHVSLDADVASVVLKIKLG